VCEDGACLMDCLRAGSNAARCRRTFGTGSVVSSRQASRKYVLKNLHYAMIIIIINMLICCVPPHDDYIGSEVCS